MPQQMLVQLKEHTQPHGMKGCMRYLLALSVVDEIDESTKEYGLSENAYHSCFTITFSKINLIVVI